MWSVCPDGLLITHWLLYGILWYPYIYELSAISQSSCQYYYIYYYYALYLPNQWSGLFFREGVMMMKDIFTIFYLSFFPLGDSRSWMPAAIMGSKLYMSFMGPVGRQLICFTGSANLSAFKILYCYYYM